MAGFLKNAWYVVAWSDEVGRELLERTVLGESLVLYRRQDGSPVVMGNRCPHRFSPLHMGKLLGDEVECPYHGLRYDSSGSCVLNPHGKLPTKAKLSTYPLVEKHNMLWIWPGDPDKCDELTIPDFSCHTEASGFRSVGGVIEMDANYELITDNLVDLTHASYLHEGLLGSEAIVRGEREVIQEGSTVWSNLWCPDGLAPPAWDAAFGHYGKPVDHFVYMRWDAPAHMLLDVGVTPPGQTREDGVWALGTDILTPVSETKSLYFWALSRNYALDSEEIDEVWRQSIALAFEGQDKPILEAQQKMLGDQEFDDLKPILLASDAGPSRVRKTLRRLIERDETPQPAKSLLADKLAATAGTAPVKMVV